MDPATLNLLIQVALPLAIQGAEQIYALIDKHVAAGGTLTEEQQAALVSLRTRLDMTGARVQGLPVL